MLCGEKEKKKEETQAKKNVTPGRVTSGKRSGKGYASRHTPDLNQTSAYNNVFSNKETNT